MNNSSEEFSDRISPIVLKEMRQAVKGKFTSWTLILITIVQLTAIGAVLIFSTDIGKDFHIGQELFMGLLAFLLFTCLFFIPLFTGFRLSSEKNANNVDLFFITTLKPSQIIWGKLFTALVVTLLFFTASLPFMTLIYLLRGLDLPTIFIILAFDFLITAGCIQFCIFLACEPGSIVNRIFLLLGALIILFVVFEAVAGISYSMLYEGIGSTITTWHFWSRAITFVSLIIIGIGFLFTMSVALISPVSANRIFGVRIYLLFTWLATGIIASIWFFTTDADYLKPWLTLMVVMFGINMLASVCQRQKLSQRIIRDIPGRPALRIPAFLLFSNPAGGLILSMLMFTVTLAVYSLLSKTDLPLTKAIYNGSEEKFLTAIGLALYACCYSLTSLDIKTIFFKKNVSTRATVIGVVAFLIIGSIVPVIIGFLLRQNPGKDLSPLWYIGNPLVLFMEEKIWVECFTFTSIWAILAFSISLPWFFGQIRSFKPAK